METVVKAPLALGSLFEILGSIRLRPIAVIVKTGRVDVSRTRMKRKIQLKKGSLKSLYQNIVRYNFWYQINRLF